MIYYLFVSFIFFCIIDYIYIYSFFESNILFSKSGSKLFKELNNNKKNSFLVSLQYNLIDISIFAFIFLILFFLNVLILKNTFNVNPIIVQIASKEVNITKIFGTSWKQFKLIYYLAYAIFEIIILFKFRFQIIKVTNEVRKLVNGNVNTDKKEEEPGIIFGKDVYGNTVYIKEETLHQNLLITGSIGSGKTSGAIANLCYELIKMGRGGLILDAKGNFVDTIIQICKKTGRMKDLKVISLESNCYFNLLDQRVSNLELASRLKQVIYLLTVNNNSDSYWFDKVENLFANLLILIDYYDGKSKNIMEIHKLVSDPKYLKDKISLTKKMLLKNPPDDKTCFEISNVLSFLQNEFINLDARISSIIKSEITRFTIPLITEYEIYNKFCVNEDSKEEIKFEDDVNQIVVLSINIGQRKSLVKIIATFLKLSFQKNVISNISNPIPYFLVQDEFQEFINTEDSNFLSLSREAKCINIISTQSYSSMKSVLKDEHTSAVIIQNLVNKVWFRNDDNYTILEAIKQLGKTDVIKENRTISENSQESRKYMLKRGFKSRKSGISNSISFNKIKENEYDENFFTRELKTFEALAFLAEDKSIIQPKKIIFERWERNG